MKPQLLVIEDESSIRENVAELLTLQGFSIDTAADGQEGINRAIQSQPEMAHLRLPPHSLTKILEELIDNAIKFSERGCDVCVSGLIRDECYQLTITNWGRAFKSSDILRIAPYT